jgi:hypothetical protein
MKAQGVAMQHVLHRPFRPSAALFAGAVVLAATSLSASPGEAPFLADNDATMTKMMRDMVIDPSGDVDTDFVTMMVPHHQGAIEMAQALLRYGHNEQLRRLAQEIIVTQQQEIAAMRLALGQPLPPSVPSPDQPSPAVPSDGQVGQAMSHPSMHMHQAQ